MTAATTPPETDLRSICRPGSETTVHVIGNDGGEHLWLRLRCAAIRCQPRDLWTLLAYLGQGATDVEEDSAYAIKLPLVGVRFTNANYGTVSLSAFVAVQFDAFDHFNVPDPGYDPVSLPETETCTDCREPHPVVPEGYYVPPHNDSLAKLVGGREVKIRFSGLPNG